MSVCYGVLFFIFVLFLSFCGYLLSLHLSRSFVYAKKNYETPDVPMCMSGIFCLRKTRPTHHEPDGERINNSNLFNYEKQNCMMKCVNYMLNLLQIAVFDLNKLFL